MPGGVQKNLEWLQTQGSLEFVRLDIRRGAELAELFRKHRDADQVLHLAAQVAVTTSVTAPREDFEINALETFNVLEAARQAGMRSPLLYSSTKDQPEQANVHPARHSDRVIHLSQPRIWS